MFPDTSSAQNCRQQQTVLQFNFHQISLGIKEWNTFVVKKKTKQKSKT